jgi:biopolymer transport protein ExbB/TolQ
MMQLLDAILYEFSQLLPLPVIVAITLLLLYAFFSLGTFIFQIWQRHNALSNGFELIAFWHSNKKLSDNELELLAYKRLEYSRISARIAPMLGLVATMIPMGPALRALGEGHLSDVSMALSQAFSAVIVALIATIIIHTIYNVKRRWYLSDLCEIQKLRGVQGECDES